MHLTNSGEPICVASSEPTVACEALVEWAMLQGRITFLPGNNHKVDAFLQKYIID
jgi:hypothetical protein